MSYLWIDLRGMGPRVRELLDDQAKLVKDTYGSLQLFPNYEMIEASSPLFFFYGPREIQSGLNEETGTVLIPANTMWGVSHVYPDQLSSESAESNGWTHYFALLKSNNFTPEEGPFITWSRTAAAVNYPIVAVGTI